MKRISRLTAWLLAIALVLGSVALADRDPVSEADLDKSTWSAWTAASLESNGPVIQEGGTVLVEPSTFVPGETQLYTSTEQATLAEDAEAEQQITLPQYGMVELTATGTGAAQWQIYVPTADLWVNIAGESAATIALTYAKISNQLVDGAAKLRCAFGSDDARTYSATAKVVVSYGAPETEEATDAAEPVLAASNFALTRSADAGVMLLEGEDTPSTYNVVINYVFGNNEIVADPYTASLAAGTSFSATVTFPTVQGYLPYVGENQQNSIDLHITNIQAEVTYTVTYKPTNVNYTVIHYKQNLDNDNYTEAERETKQGLTNSDVPEVAKTYAGFYALLYEKPKIAADGSTVVEIYYDRYYYLMNFDLDGGYGVEPIYARYGTPIENVGTPIKAGYTFQGWTLDGTTIVSLPGTMPAANTTYKAVWTANDTAKVTIVFWGENANDEEYSYIKSAQVNVKPGTEFTYSESGSVVCGQEVHTHDASCGYACGQEEHEHSIENGCYKLTCTQTSHNHTTAGCTLDCKHVHTVDCYSTGDSYSTLKVTDRPDQTLTPIGDGIHTYTTTGLFGIQIKHYYLNIDGTWYCAYYSNTKSDITEISLNCSHNHTDECYTCGLKEGNHVHSIEKGCYELTCTTPEHTHSDACGYNCGKTAHTHTSDCYMSDAGLDSNLWKFIRSDTVTVAADGSSVVNVYYDRTEKTLTFKYNYKNNKYQSTETITAKWGSDISEQYKKIAANAKSTFWSAETNGEAPYTNYFGVMPQTSATYYNRGAYGSTGTMTYWGQDLNGEYTVKLFEVTGVGGYYVSDEDRYEFQGFTYHHGTSNNSSCNGAAFYYTRNSYTLTFNDGYNDVKKETVLYEASLSTYSDFVPDPPVDGEGKPIYEPGSVTFGGWYLNPECSGAEYKLTEHTMPADNVLLYAKWVPVTHTVQFYLDKNALDNGTKLDGYPVLTVPHGTKVESVPETPKNGSYTFVGWFYMEGNVEKAFDFANMPVTKDLRVYGKWSSNVLKQYTIYYKTRETDGTETEIADSTTGSGLAGVTKTFDAKGGTDLYADYQEGYFPLTKSHSLTLDINATETNNTNVYTFWYVQKEAVPYTVKYLNKETGEAVATEKTVDDNRKAVVTETFVPVSGMMPDAYQKRLVVSVDENGDPDTDHNVIIFYYTKDDKHAYYKITHYTENLGTDSEGKPTWTEYASSQAVGNIGTTYTADSMTIPGFTYDSTVAGTVVSGELTANGLELKLYYTRNSYPYQVRYLEQGSGKQLHDPKNGTDKYGQVISESAIDITNYTAVAPTSKTLDIKIEESQTEAKLNIITFYYKEKEVTINYQVVGPDGCGTVSPTSETLKVLSGTAQGSTAAVSSNLYRFVGWYTDEACTTPVTENWVNANNKLTPEKATDAVWPKTSTYYAKFVENQVTINYVAVGPEGLDTNGKPNDTTAGLVNPPSEKVDVLTGTASGSTAKANTNYRFVGWYTDADCTKEHAVDVNWVDNNNKLTPVKTGDVWTTTTYYAKFEENTATINYVAVGPEGLKTDGTPNTTTAGSVDPDSETLSVISGTAQGSTPTASSTTYKFVGWYTNAECTNAVTGTDGNVNETTNQFIPVKDADAVWVDGTTYYAKFEYNLTTLTITKSGMQDIDNGQSFLFKVEGEGLPTGGLLIAINGNGRETISGLRVGETYKVTEVSNWSWRYTASPKSIKLQATDNEVTMTNERKKTMWLDGDCYAENEFVAAPTPTPSVQPEPSVSPGPDPEN